MEGERFLQCILQGDVQQLQNVQSYIAPLQKFLESVAVPNAGKKAVTECQQVVVKYGVFCMKLLRYCIEVLQKKQEIKPEEYFKYSTIGADMLTKLITCGINIPNEISISGVVKLLFHVIISAIKRNNYVHLIHLTDCLIRITERTCKERGRSKDASSDNKDVTSICKQTSDHLWNAAIKLEQSKSLEKQERSIFALSIRKNSLFLLSVAKPDLTLIIERGIKTARQFQLSSTEASVAKRLQKFLFDLLSKTVEVKNFIRSENNSLEEGVYNVLEELCINCYKSAVSVEHFMTLKELLFQLYDSKSVHGCQGRGGVFQTVLQLLRCSLEVRAKSTKSEKFSDDKTWSTLKKGLINITENVKKLDINDWKDSQIIQAIDCLRSSCNKLLNKNTEDTGCPQEILSSLVNLFLVCFEKSNQQVAVAMSTTSWKQIVLPRLTMLYLISSLILKGACSGLEKSLQNGRLKMYGTSYIWSLLDGITIRARNIYDSVVQLISKRASNERHAQPSQILSFKYPVSHRKNSFKSDYVAAMLAGKTLLDDLVQQVPTAAEHYRYLASDAFNVGLIFFKKNFLNEATSLARLSCSTAEAWCAKKTGTKNIHEVLLFKKYELLSDCLDKQSKWEESLSTMRYCCQMYVLSTSDFGENGSFDNKALEYVEKWSTRKQHVVKQFSEQKDILRIKRSTLYNGWDQLEQKKSDKQAVCILLQMELDSYREKRYTTDDEEIATIEELLNVFLNNNDRLNVCLMKLEKVKIVYQMKTDNSYCLETCEEIISDVKELTEQNSVMAQNILASSYFWCFIVQYSITVNQTMSCNNKPRKESDTDGEDNVGNGELHNDQIEVISLELCPDFLQSLNCAVNIWTQLIVKSKDLDVLSQSEMCWNLQIASSVFGFLNMPLTQVHTLKVLSTAAQTFGGNENFQTVVVAGSLVVHILCEEGNIQSAEILVKQCEEILERLGHDCCPATKYLFLVAKSYLFLLKGLYDDGWQILNDVLLEINNSKKAVFQLVLLKAKLLGWKYLSLPPSTWESPIKDLGCIHLEFLADSLRRAEALLEYLAGGDEMINVVLTNQHKEQHGLLLSHWSILSELSRCLIETGQVFLLQGAVREAKSYLEDGRNITKNFLSPIRLSQFTIHLAELSFLKCEMEICLMYMQQVLEIVTPGASLFDIVKTKKPFDLSKENCSSLIDDQSSLTKVLLQLLLCFCQYLRKIEKSSDVKAVILLLQDLHKISIERYEISWKYLEGIHKHDVMSGDVVHNTSKRKTKGKRGKNSSKLNETKTEVNPGKSQVASIAFLEIGFKILALESEVALFDGDYTRLLSKFQEGLQLIVWTQQFTKAPVVVDLMSISLLYYLRGVAHVLSSQTGFDSWHIAGLQNKDLNDLPQDMSRLEISPRTSLDELLLNQVWENTELICDLDEDDMLSASRRSRGQAAQDVESIKSKSRSVKSSKTTTRKKSAKKTLTIEQEVGTSSDDINVVTVDHQEDSKKDSKSTRNRSRSTKKINTKVEEPLVKTSSKTRRTTSRQNTSSTKCDVKCEKPLEQVKRGRQSKKTSKDKPVDVCNQSEIIGSISEKDEEILKAVEYFHLSLEYLHPSYNPVLFSRICHALVLCYGLQSPENAAIYHNLSFATTLRHQAMMTSAKKIRKVKEELSIDEIEAGKHDDKVLHLTTVQSTISFHTSNEELTKSFHDFMDLLPSDWTVCTLSIVSSPENEHLKHLVVTRLRKEEKPLVLKLKLPGNEEDQDDMEDEFQSDDCIIRNLFAASSRTNIISEFASILEESHESMALKDKHWWRKRREIDENLQRVLHRLEDTWFGKWRGILSGRMIKEDDISTFQSNIQDIQNKASEIFGTRIENEQLLELLVEWYPLLKLPEVAGGLAELIGMKRNSVQVTKFCKAFKQFFASKVDSQNTISVPRGPVVLILDKAIQHLPFESIPVLREQEVSRMPSLYFVMAHLRLQTIKTAPVDILTSGVDTHKTFYVLNPKKDLKKTENRFHEWFSAEEGWNGVVGRPPTCAEVKEALSSHHLYLYLGHGTGREFFKGGEVQRLYCQAVTILMGCSSGKLTVQGDCDARGMVLNYLLSGCPAVVANLWDVTDGDIDRFSSALFKTWLKKDNNLSLSQCVTQCRKACLLKYLIGSAPVIYGMPVYTRH